jgi:hypothetical protein
MELFTKLGQGLDAFVNWFIALPWFFQALIFLAIASGIIAIIRGRRQTY